MLKKLSGFNGIQGPIVTIVMDGVGYSPKEEGNAVAQARKPFLDALMQKYSHVLLKAHGTAVGMPSDADMGNSEVGHNAIGAGQVYEQGAALAAKSIQTGEMFKRDAWKEITENVRAKNSTLHFIGLFSDGNVHSNIEHLQAMIAATVITNIKMARTSIFCLLHCVFAIMPRPFKPPQIIKFQLAPCQIPVSNHTIKIFLIFLLLLHLFPPKGI